VQDAVVTNRNVSPKGLSRLEVGDTVYLYEKNYAVWAESILLEKTQLFVLSTIDEIREFVCSTRKYENSFFWGSTLVDKIFPLMINGSFKAYKVFEIKLNVKKLDNPIFIEKMNEGGYRYLTDKLVAINTHAKLKSEIPSSLRYRLWDKFKIHPENIHVIDIDHVVPKSVGGPGNIEENLIPISASINRPKGDKIPAALFEVSKKYKDILGLTVNDFNFQNFSKKTFSFNLVGGEIAKQKAVKIVTRINLLDFDISKTIYNEIRFSHYPAAVNFY
jgi:hypothetical protein